MTDAISTTTTTTSTTISETSDASASLADNFEMFLTLLTEQLQNQDPLSPLDSNEFVNQLVQFSSVEQQINQTEAIEALVEMQSTENVGVAANMAIGFLSNDVEVSGADGALVDGEARWTYAFDTTASSVELEILDASGTVVATAQGEAEAGSHDFTWDGRDSDGDQLEDGVYTLRVTATDAEEEAIETSISSFGRATSVDLSSAEPTIQIGDMTAPLSDILAVAA